MKFDTWIRLHLVLFAAMGAAAGAEAPVRAPQMSYLENEELRVGLDLALGGAVTYLSRKDHPGNIINSADLGREIQMSHYSGPWPFVADGKKPNKAWAGLGWNPIQSGDCYDHPSKVLEHQNDGREIHVRCVPMQWPLENVPGDCVFETWTRLEGAVVHMRFRCANHRADRTVYRPCPQELPAVYTISKLSRLMSYTGGKPFVQEPLVRVTNDWRKPWPWTQFTATEGWAALVDDNDWGLGVFKKDGGLFHGGVYGDERSDDPKHGSTAYLAPIQVEQFDHDIIYEHRTDFMVGNLSEIRACFNRMAAKAPPTWKFVSDRQHWVAVDAEEQSFPTAEGWRVRFGPGASRLESSVRCWRAESARFLDLEIASDGPPRSVRILWRRLDDDKFDPRKSVLSGLAGGGKLAHYRVNLAASAEYRGLLTGLAIELAQPQSGVEIVLKSATISSTGFP